MAGVDDVDRLLRAGADKVAVNTAAIHRPELVGEIADRFGNQVLVLSLDARRAPGTDSGFEVTTHGGRKAAGLDAIAWATRAAGLGAGEILLNAMDADGTQSGFDLDLVRLVRAAVSIPVIASGGAGAASDFAPAVDAGADAVLAATVFHFGTVSIAEVSPRSRTPGIRSAEPREPPRFFRRGCLSDTVPVTWPRFRRRQVSGSSDECTAVPDGEPSAASRGGPGALGLLVRRPGQRARSRRQLPTRGPAADTPPWRARRRRAVPRVRLVRRGQDDHDSDVVRGGPNGCLSLDSARLRYVERGGSPLPREPGPDPA